MTQWGLSSTLTAAPRARGSRLLAQHDAAASGAWGWGGTPTPSGTEPPAWLHLSKSAPTSHPADLRQLQSPPASRLPAPPPISHPACSSKSPQWPPSQAPPPAGPTRAALPAPGSGACGQGLHTLAQLQLPQESPRRHLDRLLPGLPLVRSVTSAWPLAPPSSQGDGLPQGRQLGFCYLLCPRQGFSPSRGHYGSG